MKIGILGTGMVGNAIGTRLVQLGHQVMMGSRTADNEKAAEWARKAGSTHGTYAETGKFAVILFNCTKGDGSVEAVKAAGGDDLGNKILIDVANPLDFSKGMPPSLTISNTDSLGETIQRTFPKLRVVKALNTMNCNLMVNPAMLHGDHDVFICGNDSNAKEMAIGLLEEFGWKHIIDMGDITNARGTEMMLPIWVRLYGKLQSPNFNFHVVK